MEMNYPKMMIKRKKTYKTTFLEMFGIKKNEEKDENKEQNDKLFLQNSSKKSHIIFENKR